MNEAEGPTNNIKNSKQLATHDYSNFAHEDIVTMRNFISHMDQYLIFIIYQYTLNYTWCHFMLQQ